MKCKVINKSGDEMTDLMAIIGQFLPFAQEKMGFDRPIDVELVSNTENGQELLGKSAYYDQKDEKICIFVDNRHPKDILRSISHELMHHTQNCRGDFDKLASFEPGYAQNNAHMRNMEEEAYKAAIILRDFEDILKEKEPKIGLNEWKNDEIYDILVAKWAKKAKKIEEKKTMLTSINENKDNYLSQREKIIKALRFREE
jgi:hypothetical protein